MSTQQFQGAVEMLGGLDLKATKLQGAMVNVISVGNATTTLRKDQSGSYCLFDNAAASTVILPTPEAGLEYTFVTTVTATADHVIRTATLDTDGFLGGVVSVSAGASADSFAAASSGANDFITLNGSTTGGIAGTRIHVCCIDGENWAVDGQVLTTGTSATPFGNAQL